MLPCEVSLHEVHMLAKSEKHLLTHLASGQTRDGRLLSPCDTAGSYKLELHATP